MEGNNEVPVATKEKPQPERVDDERNLDLDHPKPDGLFLRPSGRRTTMKDI